MGNRVENGWIVVAGGSTARSSGGMHWIKASTVTAFYTPDDHPEWTGVQLVGGEYYIFLDVTAADFAALLKEATSFPHYELSGGGDGWLYTTEAAHG